MTGTAIGIDFGGTTVKSGVVRDGQVVSRAAPLRTQEHSGHESLLPEVAAIGAGLPGIMARSRNMWATGRSRNARKRFTRPLA